MSRNIEEYEEFTTKQLEELSQELWTESKKVDAILKVRAFKEDKR